MEPHGVQMEPKRAQMEPNGAQMEPHGAQMEPVGAQMEPVGAQMEPKYHTAKTAAQKKNRFRLGHASFCICGSASCPPDSNRAHMVAIRYTADLYYRDWACSEGDQQSFDRFKHRVFISATILPLKRNKKVLKKCGHNFAFQTA